MKIISYDSLEVGFSISVYELRRDARKDRRFNMRLLNVIYTRILLVYPTESSHAGHVISTINYHIPEVQL